MNLHSIGDSHCSFFLGYNTIINEYPYVAKSLVGKIYCYRIGPALAFNVNKYGTTTQSREKIEKILSYLNPEKDILMFCFGEIDCRAHILKQAESNKVPYPQIVTQCISNYLEMIRFARGRGFRVILWNAIYSANYKESIKGLEYPYYGNVHDRNKVTAEFNNQLRVAASKVGADFLNISSHLIDPETGLTNDSYYYDEIHMNNKLFIPVLKQINILMDKPIFGITEFLIYRGKLLVMHILRLIKRNRVLKYIISFLRK